MAGWVLRNSASLLSNFSTFREANSIFMLISAWTANAKLLTLYRFYREKQHPRAEIPHNIGFFNKSPFALFPVF